MKKHPILRCFLILFAVLILLATVGGLYVWHAVHSVPEFYSALEITPETRVQAEVDCDAMEQKVRVFRHSIRKSDAWLLNFTQDELNHWLQIAVCEKRPGMIPHQLSHPRGVILEDKIQVGVTVDTPEYKGVVSFELVPSVPEPNVVDIELQSVTLGNLQLPFPSTHFLGTLVCKIAEDMSLPIEVSYRDALIYIRLRLREGDIMVDNRSIELHTLFLDGKNVQLTGLVHNTEAKTSK